jgi:hypothetical protein
VQDDLFRLEGDNEKLEDHRHTSHSQSSK